MTCAALRRPASTPRESLPALHLAPASPPHQQPFGFLGALPAREARRRERAHQPHLRGRTPPAGTAQLVLPFQRRKPGSLLTPELAEAMESALGEARRYREGSPRQRAAEATLLHLLEPFLRAEVRRAWVVHERTHLSREDLLQEARVRAQKLWRGFKGGWAGPGRTLYPAYVAKAVSQHLGNVLADGKLVAPTQWARKLASRARKRVERGATYEEALAAEKADGATSLALQQGASYCEETEAHQLADTSEVSDAVRGAAAVVLLRRLPERQQRAVAAPLGLEDKRLSDKVLARQLGCTLAQLLEARTQGLAALREQLESAL